MTTNEEATGDEPRPARPIARTDTHMTGEGPILVPHELGATLEQEPDPEHDINWDIHRRRL